MHRGLRRQRAARLSARAGVGGRFAGFSPNAAADQRIPRSQQQPALTFPATPTSRDRKYMSDAIELSWKQATELSGKVAVVTGCASGIGRATAKQFAAAGVRVYAGDVNQREGAAVIEQI